MKTQIDKHTFINTFDQYGRGDNFTRAARVALFEYYEQLEEDLGEDIEFDCIAICCLWSEYDTPEAWAEDCGYHPASWTSYPDDYDDDAKLEQITEYLQDNTQIIEFDGGILVQDF